MKKFLSLMLAFILTLSLATAIGCKEKKGGVNVKYYNAASDIVPLMLSGKETIGLIPEPAVTNLEKAFSKKGQAIYKMDLQELYDSEKKAYPQAVLMVKKSVLTSQMFNSLSTDITASVEWAKEKPSNAVSAISGKFATTLNANTLTASAIDGCKIYFESSTEAKQSVNKYIDDIRSISQDSASVVDEDFFFNGSDFASSIEKETIKVACPDGAPAIAISKLIADNDQLGTGKTVEYNIVAPTQLGAQMATGASDIILMPLNGATKVYNKNASDPFVCVAVITHGNFYIMSTEQLTIDDLKDKQIAVPNMNAVPDWTIRKVLLNHGYQINVIG